jgi:magnesium-protoporphyrin IX monomethyl ester (oxidative) cyclase
VCERGGFYQLLGIDPDRFDAEVMRQTNRTARRAFPVVFELESSHYIALRDQLVDTFRLLKASAADPLGPGRLLRRLGLRARFAGLLLRQFCQPMVPAAEVAA